MCGKLKEKVKGGCRTTIFIGAALFLGISAAVLCTIQKIRDRKTEPKEEEPE